MKTRNKLAKTDGTKSEPLQEKCRRYSPQLDRVIEADSLEEWNEIVQKELKKAKSLSDNKNE